MINLLNGDNSGVVVDFKSTDFRASAETGVVYKAVLEDGDWTKYKPTDEWQRRYLAGKLGYDTNSCTDFSALNSVEAQVTRMMDKAELPSTTIDKMAALGYLDSSGRPNFNDWYNAVTAGTTDANGNTLYGPWDAIRKDGLIPQKDGCQVNDFTTADKWFGTKPTADQYALGRQFLTMFDVKYEWVTIGQLGQWDAVEKHLKQAPLHALVPTRDTWNNAVVKNVGPYTGVNHAIGIYAQTRDIDHTILDHYNPFMKKLEWNYYIPYILKGVVTPKVQEQPPQPFHYTFQVNLKFNDAASEEVRNLQKALQFLGLMNKGVFGPYGPQTAAALGVFQKQKGIQDPDGPGHNFGPKSRFAMNTALL